MNQTTTPGVTGNKMRTLSGRYIDFANPQPDQFTFDDIATGIGGECRFGNQLEHHYSVAEHCVHCLEIARLWPGVGDSVLRAVLMHDAAEAFCKDIPKPLKIMLPNYKEVEERLMEVINRKYGLQRHGQFVKNVDLMALKFEKSYFGSQDEQHDLESIQDVTFPIQCWERRHAADIFFGAAKFLGIEVDK